MTRHTTHFEVRDYECDLQGIVNNAVYQNYLEHARHKFLLTCGLDFAQLAQEGIHLVVIRAELDYKSSLTSGDHFEITTEVSSNGRLRFDFLQNIVRTSDKKCIVTAKITGTAAQNGRPIRWLGLEKLIQ